MENPYSSPVFETAPGKTQQTDVESIRPLYEVRGWLKFLGIVNIIGGVLQCITIVGAVVGWVPLVIGIYLNDAASKLEDIYHGRGPYTPADVMNSVALVIKVLGILTLIGLVIPCALLALLLFIGIIAGVAANV